VPTAITAITLRSRLYAVNAYLATGGAGFVLIDTGLATKRAELERELASAGCRPGGLRLVVITHGDADHAGNAAHLRRAFGTRIAMHPAEWPAVARGNMLLSRARLPLLRRMAGRLLFRFAGLRPADRFEPDLPLADGNHLGGFGLDARVLHLPGHSRGSIGILTADGDLLCGDLLTNLGEPKPTSLVDDRSALDASIERLRSAGVRTVYPGHGAPFAFDQVRRATSRRDGER
jgi:hydroxyacylglutathione hydrolase